MLQVGQDLRRPNSLPAAFAPHRVSPPGNTDSLVDSRRGGSCPRRIRMKLSKQHKLQQHSSATEPRDVITPAPAPSEAPSLPAVVASAFTRLRLAHRVRVLRRLLIPVGPLALAVVGGGVFAKYAAQARWPRMAVTLEDAARVTSNQVFELVRYVEQSNPQALQQVLLVLSRDATTMAAVGASVAALVVQHLSSRKAEGTRAA